MQINWHRLHPIETRAAILKIPTFRGKWANNGVDVGTAYENDVNCSEFTGMIDEGRATDETSRK